MVQYETPGFIPQDPVSVPHAFQHPAEIEISGLFAAVFSWGLRKTILVKSFSLMDLMDRSPLDFILHHQESDLERLRDFKHRTFQYDDLLYFIRFLNYHYRRYPTLESAFLPNEKFTAMEASLEYFHHYFFSLDEAPRRTRKHISHPGSGSTCKRLCMYLRWMVRPADRGVDFGLWRSIRPKDLLIPLDVHVHRVAIRLGLIRGKNKNWKTVLELTGVLKELEPDDPVKYDFALFNLGQLKQPV